MRTFEDTLTDDEIGNTHYAYRVVFARIDGKRVNGETDEVIKFLLADSPQAQGLNVKYALIKELEWIRNTAPFVSAPPAYDGHLLQHTENRPPGWHIPDVFWRSFFVALPFHGLPFFL